DTFGLIIATVFAVCFSIVIFSVALKYLQQRIQQKSIPTVCEKIPPLVVPKVLQLPHLIKKEQITTDKQVQEKIEEAQKLSLPIPLSVVPSISEKPATVTKTIAKIAIILDDVGYSTGGFVSKLWQIKVPLTMSVIPGLICSKESAEISHRCGFEVMLHMPMEYCGNSKLTDEDVLCMADRKNNSPYKWALLSGMSEKEVQRQLEGAIKDVPYFKGINNHMGSKATADLRLMTLFMDKLKGKGVYFVDSMTTPKTVAYRLAKEYGINAARRNVFLDNMNDITHVKQQMYSLIAIAKKNGTAIGIGHATKASTIAVLAEMVPELRAQGIEVVPTSELVH
ncbi:divergent polysaccharide deacetylase family protein, partial [Candidatus Desantisbacteria bacterium]|nr:divergent polysaccharide deacetylase family protein [Candidatus Desantisbacteria bacterium]